MTDSKRYNRILQVIDDHLIPDEEAKKQRGEVFTPPDLVREMLFGLRKDKLREGKTEIFGVDNDGNFIEESEDNRVGGLSNEVWRNPNLKWLDPSNGIGNFPVIAFYKLDYELSNVKGYEEKEKRHKHIIENMLFMIEIDKGNCITCRQIFRKIDNDAKPNICCADTLSMNDAILSKVFDGVNRFDIIMGNPPFQKPKEGHLKGGFGGRTLWDEFVKFSLKILNTNKFLVFLHPPGWRKPESDLYKLMTSTNYIQFLKIFPKQNNWFNIPQRFDYYVLIKTINESESMIVNEQNKIENVLLSSMPFIPNYNILNIKKFLVFEGGIDVIYSRSKFGTDKVQVKSDKSKEFKYPIIHEMNQKGLGIRYTNKPDFEDKSNQRHFGVSKVILSFNEKQYPLNDYEGTYGMSQITFGLPISSKKEGDNIVKAINSDEFADIIKATKWGAFQTEYKMFRYLKKDFWKSFISHKLKQGGRITRRKLRYLKNTTRKN